MTIILMQIANGTKQEIDEHTPINDVIKKLGPKAKKAKFFGPGSRELKLEKNFADQGIKPGEMVIVNF